MTAREYCRLQGAPDIDLAGITENQGRFALGDCGLCPGGFMVSQKRPNTTTFTLES